MAKNRPTKSLHMAQCKCTSCGQVATAKVDSLHFYCKGLPLEITRKVPNLSKPDNKGTWKVVEA